tara:strand:+ start:1801 stop:2127 length:327 start_codon:yes stop_codon:yes gene_type:complete
MISNKHTPGPWKRNIKPATKYNTIYAGRNTHITHLAVSGLNPEEVEANCDLIAAAPETAAERDRLKAINAELLNALELTETTIKRLDKHRSAEGTLEVVHDAIAKAQT